MRLHRSSGRQIEGQTSNSYPPNRRRLYEQTVNWQSAQLTLKVSQEHALRRLSETLGRLFKVPGREDCSTGFYKVIANTLTSM